MDNEYVIMPMADYVAACNSIRSKTGRPGLIKSGDMYVEIASIETGGGGGGGGGGITPSGSIEITANGIYDVTSKAIAIVSVSGTSLPMAEGVRF